MIKFRGIPLEDTSDIDEADFDGTFIYGNYIKYGEDTLIIGDALQADEDGCWPSWWVPVNSKTVGQSTGLKDVNGNEIYTGDILEVTIDSTVQADKYLVKNVWDPHVWTEESDGYYAVSKMKVQGNVHKNPELLED